MSGHASDLVLLDSVMRGMDGYAVALQTSHAQGTTVTLPRAAP